MKQPKSRPQASSEAPLPSKGSGEKQPKTASARAKQGLARKVFSDPLGAIAVTIISLIVVASIFAQAIAPFAADFVNISVANVPPLTPGYLLGADSSGRDVLSRLLVAGQLTLIGAAVTVVIAVSLGVIVGLIAGYFGGIFDTVSNWIAELLMVLPSKIVLVALFAVVGPNTIMTMAVLGVMVAPGFFRLVRSLVISVKNELYVDAARVSGLSDAAIIGRHVLMTVRAPIVIQASFVAGIAVVIQAGLEFIGLGDPSTPTWGGMLQEAFVALYKAPTLIIWPGVIIGLFVGSFILLGNVVRDTLEGGSSAKVSGKTVRAAKAAQRSLKKTITLEGTAKPVDSPALLNVSDLQVVYPNADGTTKTVVHDVSLSVAKGEVLGLVGESGSGKTQTAFAILGLLPEEALISQGHMLVHGQNLAALTVKERNALLGRKIAYIPQEPMSNLDPAFRVGYQLVEPMRSLLGLSRSAARAEALALLKRVGINDPERTFNSYPHQISGGMAQRVLIAGAISCNPELLIADEPTTALDVTVQAEILDILRGLQKERGMAMILVTHNFGVVADLCDRVAVMQLGRIVEQNTSQELFSAPQHSYTKMLLGSTLEGGPARPAWQHKQDAVRQMEEVSSV